MNFIERITERVTRLGHPDDPTVPTPLLSISEFFDGNTVIGSIGCNLEGEPSPDEFRNLFIRIASRPDVADVRIQITAFDDPEWPFSDTVWFMTSAPVDEVRSWFPKHLEPDEVWEGWIESVTYEPYSIPPDNRPVAAWWD